MAAFARRHPHVSVTATSGSHDSLYELVVSGGADVVFNDKRRAFSDDFVNRHLMTCYDYIEVSEGSNLAWMSEVSVAQLADEPCILIASEDQHETERTYYQEVLNFPCTFLFASTVEEGRMMVASNQGFMPVEAREDEPRTGTVIRRIPLVREGEHLRHEYYAFWLKSRANPLIEEFADILGKLFAAEAPGE